MAQVTEGRILDCIADACNRIRKGDPAGAQWVWFQCMTADEHLAFDLFLVRVDDPLAYVAGHPFTRFDRRVRAMVQEFAIGGSHE
jgi:hypothetical protein